VVILVGMQWKGYEDHSSAAVLSETAIGAGLTIGPLVAGGLQLAAGGGQTSLPHHLPYRH
jgi:hypothetical protein